MAYGIKGRLNETHGLLRKSGVYWVCGIERIDGGFPSQVLILGSAKSGRKVKVYLYVRSLVDYRVVLIPPGLDIRWSFLDKADAKKWVDQLNKLSADRPAVTATVADSESSTNGLNLSEWQILEIAKLEGGKKEGRGCGKTALSAAIKLEEFKIPPSDEGGF